MTATKQEVVTFYSWIDTAPHGSPSSVTIRISGGQRVKDANSGAIMALEHKEVRFTMGLLHTDDPEVIAQIRKLIQGGDTITEDKEVYLRHTMKPEDQAKRAIKLNDGLAAENAKKDKEIEELRAKLADKRIGPRNAPPAA